MPTPLQKRANDLFISYGHADWETVEPIVRWLRKSAGLRVWYDARSGTAAQRTTDLLSRGIDSARGALFLVSPNWSASAWCRDEHEVALTERRGNSEFIIVAAQIAEVEIPAWFQTSQVLDLQKFDVLSASDLLRSLAPGPPLRADNDQDIYYSGPWNNQSGTLKKVRRALHEVGWRLIGDSQDHPNFEDSVRQITATIRSCRGLAAVLPFRPGSGPHHTSRWVLDEVLIAQKLDLPYVLMAEPGVTAPSDLVERAYEGHVLPISDDGLDEQGKSTLQAFDDELSHVSHSNAGTYSFFADSLLGDATESDLIVSVIERVTNMTCAQGQYMTGQHAQEEIVERIRRAAFVVADVTDDNRNALIESGVARGAGVPLHLICRLPEDGSRKTRFMFQDMEINWYANPLERIGAVYRVAQRYRRRVLMPAIDEP